MGDTVTAKETPGPGVMCFKYLKPMHRCTKKTGHDGDCFFSKFTVTNEDSSLWSPPDTEKMLSTITETQKEK